MREDPFRTYCMLSVIIAKTFHVVTYKKYIHEYLGHFTNEIVYSSVFVCL
jgi:hypothetical protein